MFLIVKAVRNTTGGTKQTISAVASEEALEEHILRHGLDNCEVYKADKLKFEVKWQLKNKRNPENVSE